MSPTPHRCASIIERAGDRGPPADASVEARSGSSDPKVISVDYLRIAARVREANPRSLCGDQGGSSSVPLELTPLPFTEPYSTSGRRAADRLRENT